MDIVGFLPGILGSELRTSENIQVWPPTVGEAIGELAEHKLTALLDETPLSAPNAVEQICFKQIYRGVLDEIEDAGFRRNTQEKRLVVLAYDWRLDLVEVIAPIIADELDRLVDQGANSIRLVSHSMGGLVARVLLQDPRYRTRPFRLRTVQSITMASPFKGAPLAVARLMGLEGAAGIPARAFAELRQKPSLRSAYQLMPPPDTPCVWTIRGTRVSTLDLYGEFGANAGFLPDSLDSVRRLHEILDSPWPEEVSAFQFAGVKYKTVTRLADDEGMQMVLDRNSGDQTVPLSSAAGSIIPTMILPAEHAAIVDNSKLRQALRVLLGAEGERVIYSANDSRAVPEAQTVQVSVPVLGIVPMHDRTEAEVLITLGRPLDRDISVQLTVAARDGTVETEERSIAMNAGDEDAIYQFVASLEPGIYDIRATLPDGTNGETTLLVRQN